MGVLLIYSFKMGKWVIDLLFHNSDYKCHTETCMISQPMTLMTLMTVILNSLLAIKNASAYFFLLTENIRRTYNSHRIKPSGTRNKTVLKINKLNLF